eukprot:TRINITY_DN12519_c2_g1_i12.p1 TRINITY_DN12519_c2_g1~~TRINITY_DN12519_c2_g1_i12.p1  ORF type:complete len:1527 (+),score=451.98 TRINITY_DN12519_c2_g1_i12:2-4582(+)
MGLSTWIHWTAWFTKCFLFLFISTVLLTIIFSIAEFSRFSDNGVVFVFFLLYSISTIAFSFMLSTFFNKANVAAAAGAIIFYLAYVPYTFVANAFEDLSRAEKEGLCLLSPSCIGVGSNILASREASGQGVTFDNLSDPASELDDFSMASVFGMLILDTILYLLVTWYMENAFPGEYGVARPWYFPVTKAYWTGEHPEHVEQQGSGSKTEERFIEPFEGPEQAGIEIEGLRKVFKVKTGGTKTAVENLHLKMYRDQITALLGHNGAGKTTTLSMLVGLYPATSGTARVNGHDIGTNIDQVRDSLGICPQFDTLFPTLTVAEHIIFYCRLKGLSVRDAENEVTTFIKDIDLENKRTAQVSTLSGGQRRALSCAIALCGGSTFVALDEPTSGMDPLKRRHTWDMLLKHKEGRTIVLTTHFMEEADLLGDRIAIMADGELRTVGSSMFLKDRFGAGYHMTIVKGEGCKAVDVLTTVQKYIPQAEMKGNVGAELTLIIPKDSVSVFPKMFEELEARQQELNIMSYGMSITTMEEVFLKVAEGRHLNNHQEEQGTAEHEALIMPLQKDVGRETGLALRLHQFKAMFIKRYLHAIRNKNAIITQILLPLFFTFAALAVAKWGPNESADEPELRFGFDSFGGTNLRVSSSDAAGNYYSYANSPAQEFLGTIANTTLANQAAFVGRFTDMTSSDDRFDSMNLLDVTNQNMSNVLLGAADNYNENSFFKNNIAAVHTEVGNIILRDNAGITERWDGSAFVSTALTIAGGVAYSFTCIQGQAQFFSAPDIDSGNDQYFATADNGQAVVYANPTDGGETFSLACDNGATTPLTANIVNIGTGTPDTSVYGDALRVYGWYSLRALHAVPQVLNLVTNAAVRHYNNDDDARIYTYNEPLPKTQIDATDDILTDGTGFSVAIFLVFASGFLMASWMLFIIAERQNKAKHIQFVSGVNLTVFWLASFLWDLVNIILPAIGVLIMFAAFNTAAYSEGNRLGLVFLLFLLLGWAGIPFIYVLSRIFSTPAGGYAVTSLLLILGGIAMLIGVFVAAILDEDEVSDQLRLIFYIVPNFALGQALNDIYTNYLLHDRCERVGAFDLACDLKKDYTSIHEPGIGYQFIYMFVSGFVWFGLLLLFESGIIKLPEPKPFARPSREEDDDVVKERRRVEQGQASNDKVVVRDLTRVYKKKGTGKGGKFTAVDGLSLGIKNAETFGLLGVNGAGKTTTFRMLTGDERPTEGSIVAAGFDLSTDLRNARQYIGYCPQYDALIELLTGREHLVMYGRLRGVPEKDVHSLAAELISRMDLSMYADKPSGTYSGGNKRKLSTAIAIIGGPEIVYLDEPSTGVDPASKRFLWGVLDEVKSNGQSVVITSHSMEECEALCDRLTVMVNGRFRCLGSPGHLKAKFGQGYLLYARVVSGEHSDDLLRFKGFVESNFRNAKLEEEHAGSVRYAISTGDSWAKMFTLLEQARAEFQLEDYSLSQTSLEQVFLRFAAEQHVDEAEREGEFGMSLASRPGTQAVNPYSQQAQVSTIEWQAPRQ